MPLSTIGSGGILVSGYPSYGPAVRPFDVRDNERGAGWTTCPSVNTYFAQYTISLYLVEGFPWNLAQIFITSVGVAETVFKVRGQRSRS